MKRNQITLFLIGTAVGVVLYLILKESFSQPGLAQWEGKYEQIGFFRNENNTGPVIRVIAVRVLDSEEMWMKEFAEAQPHTKYGRTLVFFFSKETSGPIELSPNPPYFEESLNSQLIASFEKGPMGDIRFNRLIP